MILLLFVTFYIQVFPNIFLSRSSAVSRSSASYLLTSAFVTEQDCSEAFCWLDKPGTWTNQGFFQSFVVSVWLWFFVVLCIVEGIYNYAELVCLILFWISTIMSHCTFQVAEVFNFLNFFFVIFHFQFFMPVICCIDAESDYVCVFSCSSLWSMEIAVVTAHGAWLCFASSTVLKSVLKLALKSN